MIHSARNTGVSPAFVDALQDAGRNTRDLRVATVVSIQGSTYTLTVLFEGETVNTPGVRYMNNVIPRPGYQLLCQRLSTGDWLAVGGITGEGTQHPWAFKYYDGTTAPPGHTGVTIAATGTTTGYVPIPLPANYIDPWSMYSATLPALTSGITYLDAPTTHPGFTIPIPGIWMVGGSVGLSGATTGYYTGAIYISRSGLTAGSPISIAQTLTPNSSTAYMPLQTRTFLLYQGDKVHLALRAVAPTAATVTIQGGSYYETGLWVQYVGPAS